MLSGLKALLPVSVCAAGGKGAGEPTESSGQKEGRGAEKSRPQSYSSMDCFPQRSPGREAKSHSFEKECIKERRYEKEPEQGAVGKGRKSSCPSAQ